MWAKTSSSLRQLCRLTSFSTRRYLLTEAYACNDAWTNRLQSPLLQQWDGADLMLKVKDKLDKSGRTSAVDIDVLANKLQDVDPSQMEIAENVFYRFRHTAESVKVSPGTSYAFIRAYLEMGEADRLLTLLQDRKNYGIFVDNYTANILMDHFIKGENYADAAKIAYEVMLQEDFSHHLTRLLSLYSCSQHLRHLPTDQSEQAQDTVDDQEDQEEEIEYKVVKFIPNPYYDDHFDIRSDRFLLGKTLNMIGKTTDDVMGRSCQLIGWGLYEKFDKGLKLLQDFLASDQEYSVTQDALDQFGESIATVNTKETPEPKEEGMATIEDFIPFVTPEAKEKYQAEFQELSEKLQASGKVSPDDLHQSIAELVKSELPQLESVDIEAQMASFVAWESTRQKLVERQIKEATVLQKKAEIQQTLKELQEKEELLEYFNRASEIGLGIKHAPREKIRITKEEVEDIAPDPTERMKGKK